MLHRPNKKGSLMHTPAPSVPIIALSRNSQVNSTDLQLIQQQLSDNPIALKYIGRMLQYANSLLIQSEMRCRTHYDLPLAEVSYGNATFIFSRMKPLSEQS